MPTPALPTCPLARLLRGALVGLLLAATACSPPPVNPSFPLTEKDANAALASMRKAPQPPVRPVVVMAGYLDPGFAADEMIAVVGPTLEGGPMIKVAFGGCGTFEECRDRAIAAVLEVLPDRTEVAPGRFETVEVDVVTNSMGGLVARDAADWPGPPAPDSGAAVHADTRLRIARLMTVSAPHRGAALAKAGSSNPLERDMAPGSPFIARLDSALPSADYELICYVRLGDRLVGVENCAPPGVVAFWVPDPPIEPAHILAYHDRRLLADIARRLRGETPYATPPPAAYPAP